jgi:putative SOS response-associated peptidase YedK
MPAILRPQDYARWLETDPDPAELMISYPAEPMRMWPVSPRVNSHRNDDAELLIAV